MRKNLFILFFLFVTLSGVEESFSQNWDINLLHNINQNESPFADKSFKFITNTAAPISFGVPLTMFTVSLFNKDKDLQNNSYRVGASVLLSSLISTGLKYTFNRQRPFETYSFINKKADAGSPSFPSGHTTAAFATATSLSLAYPKWYVIAPSYLWAASVAYSRMYLGVHYPSDVLGGIVIGVGTSFLVWKGEQWLNKK